MEIRVAGRGTDMKARETRCQAWGASPYPVDHAADRCSDEDTGETGPGRMRIAAPGTRRLTFMAAREESGVAQRPLEEQGGKPGRVGQLPAAQDCSRTETERKRTNASDKKRTEDRVGTDDLPDRVGTDDLPDLQPIQGCNGKNSHSSEGSDAKHATPDPKGRISASPDSLARL